MFNEHQTFFILILYESYKWIKMDFDVQFLKYKKTPDWISFALYFY